MILRRLQRPARPAAAPVPAWKLTEGSTLPDDRTVVLVEREPAAGVVYVLTDEPGAGRATYLAEEPVDVVRLLR